MTRQIRNRTGLSFDDWNFSNAKQMSGGAQAGGLASTPQNFSSLNSQSADFGKIGQMGVASAGAIGRAALDKDFLIETGRYVNERNEEAAKLQRDFRESEQKRQTKNNLFGQIASTGLQLGLGAIALSDENCKNTINEIDDALTTLRKLRPVTFYYNEEYSSNPERMHRGFIAQEYKEVLPSATYYDESSDLLCIDTHELIALLVRSVQQLELKIGRLEAVNALEGVK